MARFNEILTGRFNRALQKELQLKGGPPAAQLASEIMPVIAHFRDREARITESWNLYAASLASTATAGIVTGFRLRNPKTSNVVAVVERIFFHNRQGADQVSLDYRADNPTDFGTVINSIALDARNPGRSALSASQASAAVTVVSTLGTFTTTAQFQDREIILTTDQELLLLPGAAISIISGTINTSVEGALWWRERALEDSELSA